MKNRVIIIVACIVSLSCYSQKGEVTKADKDYEKFAYIDAIKVYERVFEKGYKTAEMLQKLGNSYYFNADLEKSAKWYGELFALTQDLEPEYYYRYAQSLKSKKEYSKADAMLQQFNQKSGNDLRGKLAEAQKDYLEVIKKNSGRFTIENVGINSEKSDYGTAYLGNKVVFASAKETNENTSKHNWTNQAFTNLYSAEMGEKGSLTTAEYFGDNLNSKLHESTPVFTKDGKTVYFTRNNFLNGKKGFDTHKTILLKLYRATLVENKWTNITELPFNSDNYSVAHPALSADEKILYFASDMPGTLGQSDLFKVEILSDGTYGTPQNLGKTINTEGRETFPYMANDELYFASDGHPGLGGLDVFVSREKKDGGYIDVTNVGEPINTPKDDFCFVMNASSRLGYVTSNRDGGHGSDDIYKFKEIQKLHCEQLLSVVVTDSETGLIIANAKVVLTDADYNVLEEKITDAEGKIDFGIVNCENKLYIRSAKDEYNTDEIKAITGTTAGKNLLVSIELEKTKKVVKQGDDLAKKLSIHMIYFNVDKYDIREDAKAELAKVLVVLEENPNMEIDVRSHTDCRSSAKYNLYLSGRRAQATKEWLVSNGIKDSRITAVGYGESKLVNNCPCEPTNESKCSEAEHQANRRSEFIITKL